MLQLGKLFVCCGFQYRLTHVIYCLLFDNKQSSTTPPGLGGAPGGSADVESPPKSTRSIVFEHRVTMMFLVRSLHPRPDLVELTLFSRVASS